MIKLKKEFDLEFDELCELDQNTLFILDMFLVDSFHKLVKVREEYLQNYLMSAENKTDFKDRQDKVIKYFDTKTLNKSIRNLIKTGGLYE